MDRSLLEKRPGHKTNSCSLRYRLTKCQNLVEIWGERQAKSKEGRKGGTPVWDGMKGVEPDDHDCLDESKSPRRRISGHLGTKWVPPSSHDPGHQRYLVLQVQECDSKNTDRQATVQHSVFRNAPRVEQTRALKCFRTCRERHQLHILVSKGLLWVWQLGPCTSGTFPKKPECKL